MDVERAAEELTERKVVRRGLLAGIAALGAAAAMKVTGGTRKAEATDDGFIQIGNDTQTAQTATRLIATPAYDQTMFAVHNGTTTYSGNRTGLIGTVGGNANSWGVFGANESSGTAAIGVEGRATSGTGGIGVLGATTNLYGVQGSASQSAGFGVRAVNTFNGTALKAVSNAGGDLTADGNGSGIAITAKSNGGFAIQATSSNNIAVVGYAGSVAGAGLYGENTALVTDAFGTKAWGVRGVTSGGIGVEGQASHVGGFGVRAVNTANGTALKGVSNTSSPVPDGDGSGTGVQGKSGSGVGVQGVSTSGSGVEGTSTLGHGVKGTASNSDRAGVFGEITSLLLPNTYGVYGKATTGTGVRGEAITGKGIHGVSGGDSTGVKGVSNSGGNVAADGNGSGHGVHGKSGSGNGVVGESNGGFGVLAISQNSVAIYGSSTNYVGLWGDSYNSIGMTSISRTANIPAVYAINTITGAGKFAGQFEGDVFISGNLMVGGSGNKNAVVPHPDGSQRVLYCQESPEAWFEDFGRAQVVGGVARVRLDPDFAPLVIGTGYHVFLQAEGNCKGLFVSQQDPAGFEVREMEAGTHTLPISYRIVAKRRDTASPRLARVDPKITQRPAVVAAALAAGGPAGAPGPNGLPPTPIAAPPTQPPTTPPSNITPPASPPTTAPPLTAPPTTPPPPPPVQNTGYLPPAPNPNNLGPGQWQPNSN